MKRFLITAHPYVTQFGSIDVPDEIADSDDKDDVSNYINEHFYDIDFDKPMLDYFGTDFEFEKDDDE